MYNPKIQTLFEQSILDYKNQNYCALIVFVKHPNANIIQSVYESNSKLLNNDALNTWLTSDMPWLGAAVWIMPKSLENELINAHCGALFSFSHTDSKLDQAFIQHLGPAGLQVGSSSFNSNAFSNENWPIPVHIASFELRSTSLPKIGCTRPSHWTEPLPLMKYQFDEYTSPDCAPNFNIVANILANQMKENALIAINEENDLSETNLDFLGTINNIDPVLLKSFNRIEHPMFGASKLETDDKQIALNAIYQSMSNHEKQIINQDLSVVSIKKNSSI